MRLIISGAGICGLTLAITAKRAGLNPLVIQKSLNIYTQTFGGGIGLWPPSQKVYEQLGLLNKLQQVSGLMPNPCYTNQKGWKLGQPSQNFTERYKILCLQRQALTRILYQECQNLGIQIQTGTAIVEAISSPDKVNIQLSTGQKIETDILIGADGINSVVRNIIMKELNLPAVNPSHCGYAYFRAVIDLSKVSQKYKQNVNKQKWYDVAFQSWGEQQRFGYVPLKQPKTFWFFSIPINKQGLQQFAGSHVCTQQQKQWILKQISHWKSPLNIKQLVQMTPAQTILRTDIRKIKGVTTFPWSSKYNNIFIVGDAANATAPNLAQGAGLAIESAWDIISMIDFSNKQGLKQYLQRRRKRAITVQTLADLVATIGQINKPFSLFRDVFMAGATKILPSIQQRIFETAVRYSVGGSQSIPHWLPSLNKNQFFVRKYQGNILKNVVGQQQFSKLPSVTKKFRSSLIGKGQGTVDVKSSKLGKIFGLPQDMQNQKFLAFVDVIVDNKTFEPTQKWTRIFGANSKKIKKYSTIHQALPDFNSQSETGLTLTQSVGDLLVMKWIKFGYQINLKENLAQYNSNSLWFGSYKLPIPLFLLPKSEWIEQQTQNGWKFDGKIKLPSILGGSNFFQYKGQFIPKLNEQYKKKHVVIPGGSGFIGQGVAKYFYQKGWAVTILSRKGGNIPTLPFAKNVKWNPAAKNQQKKEQIKRLSNIFSDCDIIVNLAGQNAGNRRWNQKFKDKILQSRMDCIQMVIEAMNLSKNQNCKLIQAGAAGYFGNRGDQILKDDSKVGQLQNFREKCCAEVQNVSKKLLKTVMIARIGNVLGQGDGLYPFLKYSSIFRLKQFGRGGQYIPWVHIQDTAGAIYYMANNPQKFEGKSVNVSAPQHHTYQSLYKTLAQIHNRPSYFTIPQFLIKLTLGQLSTVLLQSIRMHPQKLLDEGFTFKYQKLEDALRSRQLL